MAVGILEIFEKQPGETKALPIAFAQFLTANNDAYSTHEVDVGTGLTFESSAYANGVVTVFVSGGTDKQSYKVTVRVTTSGGRVEEADVRVKVKES